MPSLDETVDAACVPDTFANDLVCVDQIGPNLRLTFTVPRRISGSCVQHEVVARLLVSKETAVAIAQRLLQPAAKIDSGMPSEYEKAHTALN